MVSSGRLSGLLGLDADSLDPASLSMDALQREIGLRRRPLPILRSMMSALEAKRQASKIGWSRPWNKVGLNVFLAHRLFPQRDQAILRDWRSGMEAVCSSMPPDYRDFADSLWTDPSRMAFVFYHNRSGDGAEYEGLTLSLGRKVPGDPNKRDRIDIMLEDLRVGGAVDRRPDRARLIVNPFAAWAKGEIWSCEPDPGSRARALDPLYASALEGYRAFASEPGREWTHWAFRYIDYFGPRAFIPKNSAFT
jgi:hypothetical protein